MQITSIEVTAFLNEIPEPRKTEMLTLIEMCQRLTQKPPQLWGTIIGFGSLHYRYKTGHEGDMPIIGLANRKNAITLYLSYNLAQYPELAMLGKHTIGKACLYVKRLSDIDLSVLEVLIKKGIQESLSYDFITDNEAGVKA